MTITESDIRRFLAFVPAGGPDECWEWGSTRNRDSGYGKFWLNGGTRGAHRASYLIHKGPIPDGCQVRHTCDNPPCVNPAHLLVGTGLQNARDALDRGRYLRGEENPRAKLSTDQVCEIKNCWLRGETQVSMARRFGVSRAAIQWVLKGKSWAHLREAS